MVQLQTGQMVGQYRIVKEIGSGGFAKVYKAIDTEQKDLPFVALKVAYAKSSKGQDEKRFIHECKILSTIDHDNLVTCFEHGADEDYLYLALELIEGENLAEKIDREKGLNYLEATKIVLDVARTFPYLEDMEVVHRDVKPKNILIDSSGKATLIDFGLAKSPQMGFTETKDYIYGTAYFLAPEYIKNGDSFYESDVYALGVTYYNAITDKFPFDDASTQRIMLKHVRNQPVIDLDSGVPEAVRELIFKMLRKKPFDRPGADELIAALERIVKGSKKNPKPKPWKLIHIVSSRRAGKKFVARFKNKKTGRFKNVHFGGKGYSDYTKHKDPERKERYLKRHKKNENWQDPTTPGALSRWVLWNLPTFDASVNDFVKRFNLD